MSLTVVFTDPPFNPPEHTTILAGWCTVTHDDTLDWAERANCAGCDPDLFFPERGVSVAEARAVCRSCVVRTECLDYALAHRERFGVWGGTTENERRRIRRDRGIPEDDDQDDESEAA